MLPALLLWSVFFRLFFYLWKPDWKAFYEACDKDLPIQPVKSVFIQYCHRDIEIWSGRCESVRKKTEKWISDNIIDEDFKRFSKLRLKMRPIGDNTPDDQLKEKWLNEQCADLMDMGLYGKIPKKHTIDFVFDSDPKSIEMWRRRGIFVFDVNQSGNEF